jgi:signal transduction histidine kinase
MDKRTWHAGEATPVSAWARARYEHSGPVAGSRQDAVEPPMSSQVPTWHMPPRSLQALTHAEVEAHHRQLWENAPVGLLTVDRTGSILSSNLRTRELLNPTRSRSSSVGLATYLLPADAQTFIEFLDRVFAGTAVVPIDVQLQAPTDYESRHLRINAVSVASQTAALTITDITELTVMIAQQQKTEEQLRQLQRLELMHAMSAGIAHDFKNIVHVIESYAAILEGQSVGSTNASLIAREIMCAASRGAMLANRWLAFGRQGGLQKERLDVVQFVVERTKTIKHVVPPTIQVETTCALDPIYCELDSCLMDQVLLNLCLNARDAMPQGGLLRVSIESVEFQSQASSGDLLPPGMYAKLSVEDNGQGMEPENLEHIFEPFFTTKESVAGTGLGLALVRGIVSDHQGAIEVWSEVGVGSVFAVYLPVVSK